MPLPERTGRPYTPPSLRNNFGENLINIKLHAGIKAEAPGPDTLSVRRNSRASLSEPRLGTGAIAGQVGYQPEAAFSKAFKTAVRMGPGADRRRHPSRN